MTPRNRSLTRAFALLAEIAGTRGATSVPRMARRLELPAATAHRLVASLESLGAVVKAKRGHYHIGQMVAELGRAADLRASLAALARPGLRKLARTYRKTAHLAVFDDDMVTYLAKERCGSDDVFTVEGTQLDAYCSGVGKVLLAHLPDAYRRRYFADGPFPRLTRRTLVHARALHVELARIRRCGYAIDDEEFLDGLKCVAVPVLDGRGRAFAALSVSGTAGAFTPEFIESATRDLQELADRIRRKLHPPDAGAPCTAD